MSEYMISLNLFSFCLLFCSFLVYIVFFNVFLKEETMNSSNNMHHLNIWADIALLYNL